MSEHLRALVVILGLAMPVFWIAQRVLCPGLIDTEYWDGMPSGFKEQAFTDAAARLPVGRVGTPWEVAQAAVMLLTNGFINGSVVVVDGGGSLV